MCDGGGLTSSEPLAEVQRALLVVLVLHAPHPEAGGLLGLRKLREHYMSSWDNPERWEQAPSSLTLEPPTRPLATPPPRAPARRRRRAVLCVVESWRRGTRAQRGKLQRVTTRVVAGVQEGGGGCGERELVVGCV